MTGLVTMSVDLESEEVHCRRGSYMVDVMAQPGGTWITCYTPFSQRCRSSAGIQYTLTIAASPTCEATAGTVQTRPAAVASCIAG